MKLKLACADFAFPLLLHEQALRLIAMLGFEGVDIGLFEERSHLWPSREFTDVSRSAGTLEEDRRSIWDCAWPTSSSRWRPTFARSPSITPNRSRDAKARDWFAANARICRGLRLRPRDGLARRSRSRRRVETTRCRGPPTNWPGGSSRPGNCGITLGVEAHVGSIVPDPASARELLSRVAGLTLTLDYTHFTRAGLPDEADRAALAAMPRTSTSGARGQAGFRSHSRTT